MFRREPAAVADWSPENVAACALRQQAILRSAADAVRPGGALVYATCTFSPAEDGEGVRAFLIDRPDYALVEERTLYPHTFPGEGQYMALLVRRGDAAVKSAPSVAAKRGGERGRAAAAVSAGAEACLQEALRPGALPEGTLRRLPDGRVLLLPADMPPGFGGCRVLRAGLFIGEDSGGRFLPAHALAMALPADAFTRTAVLDDAAARRYLAGETAPCGGESGWGAAVWNGFPLGLIKISGGVGKNHLPKGLRIRDC